MTKGLVFSVERCCAHDGPGIRTIVFLKGCPLKCLWCCNPEGQLKNPELMYSPEKCIGCNSCLEICPNAAIVASEDGRPLNVKENCRACGKCSTVCPSKARVIIGRYVSREEIFEEILKDFPFYKNSNGGVTISGGEPLMQPAFCEDLLKECKGYSIHTAIETSGKFKWEECVEAIKHTELFLYDIKVIDSKLHRKYMGSSNEDILKNAIRIASLGKEIIIRVPIIPGINTSKKNISAISEFAVKLGVKELHLLPYHKLAISKYRRLNLEYKLSELEPIQAKALKSIIEILKNQKLTTYVGG